MPVIATNTAANTAITNLNRNSAAQQDFITQLSSGSRINRASDDAAGLAVSSQVQSDITTLQQSARNAEQAVALLQTADGALARQGDILQRLKALATQFNAGTVDAQSQGFINDEYTQLLTQLDLISSSTEFNGTNLIDGSFNENFIVGIQAEDNLQVDLSAINTTQAGLNLSSSLSESNTSFLTLDLNTLAGEATNTTLITDLVTGITGAAAADTFGITLDINGDGTLTDAGDVDGSAAANEFLVAADSTIGDYVSFINSVTNNSSENVFSASFENGTLTVSLLDPNALDADGDGNTDGTNNVALVFVDAAGTTLAIDGLDSQGAQINTLTGAAVNGVALSSINDDLSIIDTAIADISEARSLVGGFQSAFQFQGDVVNTLIENLTAARSTIVDVDIAEAQTGFTNAQVLTEAATAALSQANQLTTSLLQLLR